MWVKYLYKTVLPWRLINDIKLHRRYFSSNVTVGVLIIGDEILNGQTEDTNTCFLIKNLNNIGLKISRITTLPDHVDIVANEVSAMSQQCSVVITSGGIGPTHDDITYQAVAKACGDGLAKNEQLASLLRDYFGPEADQNPAVTKFCSIPQSAVLNFGINKNGSKNRFPIVSTNNIYMLPGVPMLLQKGFEVFKSSFLLNNPPNQIRNIFLAIDEFSATPILNEAVELFKETVKFGSYPSFSHNYYRVKIVLESLDEHSINEAHDFLMHRLPAESMVTLKATSAEKELLALCETHPSVREAITVTEKALEKYSLSEVCICFNGGKDCTALLHLIHCCCVPRGGIGDWDRFHALYVRSGDTFREVEDFISFCIKHYRLNLVTMRGDLKASFGTFLEEHSHIKAVFMGTRKGDPGAGGLEHFNETDKNWPTAMRILPLLNWSYRDVWAFLRNLQLPYCTLYDRGYTSLGNKLETAPNPALLKPHQKVLRSYRPAYLLEDGEHERNGRK